jgi:RNA polymerase sigma-70 factor (ECF subfamily)
VRPQASLGHLKPRRSGNQRPEKTAEGGIEMAALVNQIVAAQDQAAAGLLALREWIAPYETRLYHLALTLTGNQQDAEKALEETVAQAWQALGSPVDDGTARWLKKVAVEQCLALLRYRTGDLAGWIEEPDTFAAEMPADTRAWEADPARLFSPREWQKIKSVALDSLTPIDRVVFLLRDALKCPAEETAALVGKPAAAVRARSLRARLRLREFLAPLCRAARSSAVAQVERVCSGSKSKEERKGETKQCVISQKQWAWRSSAG